MLLKWCIATIICFIVIGKCKSEAAVSTNVTDTDAILDSYFKEKSSSPKAGNLQYERYVKGLLFSALQLTLPPEPLGCIELDPQKRFGISFGSNETVRICDICPSLPFDKYENSRISFANATLNLGNYTLFQIYSAVDFPNCISKCTQNKECVAVTFAKEDGACVGYRSTEGAVYDEEDGYVTVLPNQPTGFIQDWVYSRNTKISIMPGFNVTPVHHFAQDFLSCVEFCQLRFGFCNSVSYDFSNKLCYIFSPSDPFNEGIGNNSLAINLVYGQISAFRISSIYSTSSTTNFWRFGTVFQLQEKDEINTLYFGCQITAKFGWVDNPVCKLQPLPGCDLINLGKQKCRYPENVDNNGSEWRDLPICPNSRYTKYLKSKKEGEDLEKCYQRCLDQQSCAAITFSNSICDTLTYQNLTTVNLDTSTWHKLRHSKNSAKNFQNFEFYVGLELNPVTNRTLNNTIEECIELCNLELNCQKVSFNFDTNTCIFSQTSNSPPVIKANSKSILFDRLPPINSTKVGFALIPFAKISGGDNGMEMTNEEFLCSSPSCSTEEEICFRKCMSYKSCDFVEIVYVSELKLSCHLWDQNATNLERSPFPTSAQVYIRRAKSLTISMKTMDALGFFQPSDFFSCFRQVNFNSQTLSTLGQHTEDLFEGNETTQDKTATTSNTTRRKRGVLDDVKNFFKSVGEGIVETVKDIGTSIVKTGETIGKVFQGDWEGAKEKFMEIPVVQDVKNTVETVVDFGKAVASGDASAIGEALLSLGTEAIGVLPVGGRIGGKVAKKVLKKIGKKGQGNAKRQIEGNASRKKRDTNNGDKKKSKQCPPKRSKRATSEKRGRDCDDDDDDKKTCTMKRGNGFDSSGSNCDTVKPGKSCTFLCHRGYDESSNNGKCVDGKFNPLLTCKPQSCGNSADRTFLVKAHHPITNKDFSLYFVKFDERRKIPVYSAAFIDPINFHRGYKKRHTDFAPHPCKELDQDQLTDANYLKSGWAKGHLTPYDTLAFSRKAAYSSNLYVNAAPQDPKINSGPWRAIEGQTMCFSKRHPSLVVTGVCPKNQPLGSSTMKVPACYWKLICYSGGSGKTQVVGFITDNSKTAEISDVLRNQVYTLRSQDDVAQFVGGNIINSQMWTKVYKNLGIRAVPLSVNAVTCGAAHTITDAMKEDWKDKIKDIKANGPIPTALSEKTRKKRAVEVTRSPDSFGCTSKEMQEHMAFISSLKIGGEDNENEQPAEGHPEHGDGADGQLGGKTFAGASCGKRLIGYYPSWGTSRFTNVQGHSLTHAVFAFFETFADGGIALGSADSSVSQNREADTETSKTRLANFQRVCSTFDHLKCMFAVGGWENSQYFSAIAADPSKRIKFISSTIQVLDQYELDGIDIDWEHPVTGGAVNGIPNDKENYVTLMQELRTALDSHQNRQGHGEKFLLSFAGAAGQWTLDPGLDLPSLLKHADWVNVMTYDYFGAWDSKWGAYTGAPAPLYFGNPNGFSGKVNAHWTLKYYVCKTKHPHQINMGVPFYGRFWRNVGERIDPLDGMWRMAEAQNGKFDGGFVPWKDIKKDWMSDTGFSVTMHDKAKVPYAFNSATRTFLGFENPQSLDEKVKYAEKNNLGGLMIWAIDQDDDDYTMLNTLLDANLCKISDDSRIAYQCPPIEEKRWWTPEDGYDKAGMCGKSAPLYKGYYPVCDPDDPGYSCCGAHGYCGSGPEFCSCPTCIDYLKEPQRIVEPPTKPTVPVTWFFQNEAEGKRGRCGRNIPLLNGVTIPTCNPDDKNAHCCSNGQYCGSTKEFCECDGCIDFSKNPTYVYKEKTWWEWSDGEDKSGRCGIAAPKLSDGQNAGCNADSSNHCCSVSGWCGSGSDFCNCDGCRDYRSR